MTPLRVSGSLSFGMPSPIDVISSRRPRLEESKPRRDESGEILEEWKQRARELKREVYALYFACRDPRVPWYAKALAIVIVAYAFSPVDLIPDFIPILGYLDELVLLPLGVLAVRAMVPQDVMEESRAQAVRLEAKPRNWVAAGVIVAIWIAITVAAILWVVG